jgi:hypothetical protein
MRILNKYRDDITGAVNIMRGSPYGNPFPITKELPRDQAIAKYAEWLKTQPELVAKMKSELKGKDLYCCCTPCDCHGRIIKEIVEGDTMTEMNNNFLHPKSEMYLIEETHTYVNTKYPDIKWTSVTTILHKFFDDFDTVGIAKKLIASVPKYRGMKLEDLLTQWENVGKMGTIIHKQLEDYIALGKPTENPKAKHGQAWIEKLKSQGDYEFFPEVILYSKDLGICGTIDLLIRDKKTGVLHIADWKTNNRISLKSYDKKTGNHRHTRHLQDCNHVHYSLQLSMYKFLLEHVYGQKVGWLKLVHLTDDAPIEYPCEYLKRTIVNILSTVGHPSIPKARVIVSGSRKFNDYELVKTHLERILRSFPKEETVIFEGGAKGVDSLAKRFCEENGWKYRTFPADWVRFDRAAGAIRNKEMADQASHLIAFNAGTSGTMDMINCAKRMFIPTVIVPITLPEESA